MSSGDQPFPKQGTVFWFVFHGRGSDPDGRRPAVIVQDDRFNRSAIATTVIAAITSNLRLAEMPGNIRLRKGEAQLPKASVINLSQLRTVDKCSIAKTLGMLSNTRINEMRRGLSIIFGIE